MNVSDGAHGGSYPCYRNLRTKYFEQMEVVMDTRVSVNTYPALFRSADTAANNKQKRYLALLRAEYATLLLASILSSNLFSDTTSLLLYAIIFLASVTLLLLRTKLKPEQDWYRCRALAESVKTLTWRYTMRASPFVDEPYVRDPLNEFTHSLNQLINDNRSTVEKIATSWSADDQITDDMNRIRKLDLKHRKDLYDDQRIQEQRNWYAKKASINRRSARIWVLIGVAAYTTAICFHWFVSNFKNGKSGRYRQL
jgi:SMODS and SLOG-associating 2TM effector domain 3/SMODS and SLOG-associating 2TM effector domain 1